MNPFILLLILNVCHWLADYSHLSTAWMLDAKRLGKPLLPIAAHAFVHTFLMTWGITLWLYLTHQSMWLNTLSIVLLIQFITHFLIDVWKGRMNGWFPALANPANKGHWYIFGFDQLLHQVVIIAMVYIACNH